MKLRGHMNVAVFLGGAARKPDLFTRYFTCFTVVTTQNDKRSSAHLLSCLSLLFKHPDDRPPVSKTKPWQKNHGYLHVFKVGEIHVRWNCNLSSRFRIYRANLQDTIRCSGEKPTRYPNPLLSQAQNRPSFDHSRYPLLFPRARILSQSHIHPHRPHPTKSDLTIPPPFPNPSPHLPSESRSLLSPNPSFPPLTPPSTFPNPVDLLASACGSGCLAGWSSLEVPGAVEAEDCESWAGEDFLPALTLLGGMFAEGAGAV